MTHNRTSNFDSTTTLKFLDFTVSGSRNHVPVLGFSWNLAHTYDWISGHGKWPGIGQSFNSRVTGSPNVTNRSHFFGHFLWWYFPQSTYTSRLLSNFKLGTLLVHATQHSTIRSKLTQHSYTTHMRRLCFFVKLTLDTQKLEIASCDSNMFHNFSKLRQRTAPGVCLGNPNRKTTCPGLRKFTISESGFQLVHSCISDFTRLMVTLHTNVTQLT